MERADFLEQPRLLVARGHIASPRGEAFATRRRGGGAPGSVRASRIDFSLPVIDTTARRGRARGQRKTSRACNGNCGDFVGIFVTAYGGMQRKGKRRVHPGPNGHHRLLGLLASRRRAGGRRRPLLWVRRPQPPLTGRRLILRLAMGWPSARVWRRLPALLIGYSSLEE
jgi:hypothetical protein